MEPSFKHPIMAETLEALTGRTTAITNGLCIRKPYGCGEPIGPFRDALSVTEYTISGLCQTCQDSIFIEEEDPYLLDSIVGWDNQ